MSQIDDDEVLLALRGTLLTVAGLPAAADRVWDDVYAVVGGVKKTYEPQAGVPYLTESFVPTVGNLVTTHTKGLIVSEGLYVLTWFGVKGDGGTAIRAGTRAITAAFEPGMTVTLPSGNTLRIRATPVPSAGRVTPLAEGAHSYSQVTIAYEVEWNLS